MAIISQTIPDSARDDAGAYLGAGTGAGTGTEQFQAAGVATITAGHAMHDTYTAFLPPLLPVLIEKFALSNAQAGLLNVFMQWPSLLQPVFGFLADRVNLRYLIILAPAVTAIAMSLLGVAPSYAVLAMLLIVVGVSSAGIHAVGPVIIGNISGRSLGRGMGLWMVGGGLGYTVGPLLIVAALGWLKLEGTPWLMIGGILASVVLYFRLRNVTSQVNRGVQSRPWRQALPRAAANPGAGDRHHHRPFVHGCGAGHFPPDFSKGGRKRALVCRRGDGCVRSRRDGRLADRGRVER